MKKVDLRTIILALIVALIIPSVAFAQKDDKNAFSKKNYMLRTTWGSQGECGLFLAYSQVNNVYEDDNLKAEIWGGGLYVTNKTDKPLYIDNKGSFMYINEADVCLFRGTETKSGNTTYIEQEIKALAPKSKDVLIRYFNNPFGGVILRSESGSLTDKEVEFMGHIESLRSDLANAPDKTSSALHLEQDETFLTIKAAINYATDPKLEHVTSFMVSSWVSDMILAKYYIEARNNDKKSSNSVSVRGRRKSICHVFADMPFEYDEDKSPIARAHIYFNRGNFVTSHFNISDVDAQNAEKNGTDVSLANHQETTFIWEGHSSDFKTSLYNVITKCLLADGYSVKDAEKSAEKITKSEVKNTLIKK